MRTIVEERKQNVVIMDSLSKLVQERVLFINEDITPEMASDIVSQLIYLDSLNNKEISIYINSPGGSIYDGLAIIDVMRIIKSPIKTVCIGKAMSMAAIILICGDIRLASENATIMLHSASGGTWGKIGDLDIYIKEANRLQNIMFNFIKNKTKISDLNKIEIYDIYYNAEQAKELGIVDEIL